MEIKKPKIIKAGLVDAVFSLETSDLYCDKVRCAHFVRGAEGGGEVSLNASILEMSSFVSYKADALSCVDSCIISCDFVGSVWSQTFLERSEIDKCRMQGTQFMDAVIANVRVSNSKCIGIAFRFAKLKNVVFTNCDLGEADFQGSTLDDVCFENCTLSRASFVRASLRGVDFRSSVIDDLIINRESCVSVKVDSVQALYLSPVFGLVVEDN